MSIAELLVKPIMRTALRNLGAIFCPTGFHHTCRLVFAADSQSDFLPKPLDHRPNVFCLVVNHQPTLSIVTLHMHALHFRQYLTGRATLGTTLAVIGISRNGFTFALWHLVAFFAAGRSQIRRHFQRWHLQRSGAIIDALAVGRERAAT